MHVSSTKVPATLSVMQGFVRVCTTPMMVPARLATVAMIPVCLTHKGRAVTGTGAGCKAFVVGCPIGLDSQRPSYCKHRFVTGACTLCGAWTGSHAFFASSRRPILKRGCLCCSLHSVEGRPGIVEGHGTNKVVEHQRAQHMAEAIGIHALGQQGADQKRGGIYHLRFCFLELTIFHACKKSAVSRTSLSTAM